MTDVVIIGAGAAGLMCALVAGQRGKSVLVLERGNRAGSKILISGGGRCNFTNLHTGPENYISANPDFCKSPLARYSPADFLAMVERHGIAYHEKKLGQLFCDHSSRDILEMLLKECAAGGVRMATSQRVESIARAGGGFVLQTATGPILTARVVIATGGLSLPKMGATDFAYRIARQYGLNVLPVHAGLVPFTFSGPALEFCRGLSGLSIACEVRTDSAQHVRFAEQMLFTHRGLSGPAMLQISSCWKAPALLTISLFPGGGARQWLQDNRESGAQLHTLLARRMPERFAAAWVQPLAPLRPLRTYRAAELDEIAQKLENWPLQPAGTEGYATAEVTCGGIDTRDLHARTMEARAVPGLHFIGEAVDVTGWLGGYNFQWAWASGHACGTAV